MDRIGSLALCADFAIELVPRPQERAPIRIPTKAAPLKFASTPSTSLSLSHAQSPLTP